MDLSDGNERDTLTKPDAPDIRFELHRVSATEFAVIEDGRNICTIVARPLRVLVRRH